jgi:hypothetical protein
MKKLTFFLLLISAGIAQADWTPVEASFNDPKLYIDLDFIKKILPGRLQVHHIADYAKTQKKNGDEFRSEMFGYEYDCDKSLFREMGHTWYKGSMASDLVVYFSKGDWLWTKPEADSKEEALLTATCTPR